MRENRTHGSEGGESLEKALLYPYSARDGNFKYVHVVWIPAVHAGMTGFVTFVYNDECSGLGMQSAMLQRRKPCVFRLCGFGWILARSCNELISSTHS